MKFGPTRGNPILIFEHVLRDFGLLMVVIVIMIFKGPQNIMDNIQFLIIAVLSPIATLVKYLFTIYSIDEEKMVIQSGVFVKKVMEIPLKAITTVDLTQNLLFQLFKIYKIKADNSSQTNDTEKKAEITFALKKESALYVKNLLEAKEPSKTTMQEPPGKAAVPEPSLTCSIFDFFLLGILQSKMLYIFSVVPLIYGGGGFLYSMLSGQEDPTEVIEKIAGGFEPAAIVGIVILCSYVIGAISSEVITTVRYYNFTVTNRESSLLVEYGLLTKKSYTLMKEKISGVTLKQSMLMRIFGYCTVELFIIGYGDRSEDNQQELSLLYPIVKLTQVDSILMRFLPEMKFDRNYHPSPKAAFRYFFYCGRMFFAVGVFLGISIAALVEDELIEALPILGGALAFVVFIVITIYLEYRNSGICANDQAVSLSTGIFTKQMIFIKTEKIESISEQTNVLKRRRGFTSIQLGFIAPLRVANVQARNMSYQEYEEVQKVLMF